MKSEKRTVGLASAALLALALMPSIAAAQDLSAVQDNGNLHLRGYGSFFLPEPSMPSMPPLQGEETPAKQEFLGSR